MPRRDVSACQIGLQDVLQCSAAVGQIVPVQTDSLAVTGYLRSRRVNMRPQSHRRVVAWDRHWKGLMAPPGE